MQEEINKLNAELNDLFIQIELLQEKIIPLKDKIKSLVDSELKARENELTLSDLLQTHHDGHESSFIYDKRNEYLKRYDPFVRSSGCYDGKTNQDILQISVSKKSTEEELKNISKRIEEEILPYINFSSESRLFGDFDKEKIKLFNVMENTLSLHGSYKLLYNEDNKKWYIIRGYHVIQTLDKLFWALTYLKSHHPYH